MNKEEWLYKELKKWNELGLIDWEQGEKIKSLYPKQSAYSHSIIIFSIVGALLSGSGIILILAKNWYALPFFLRAGMAFLPLITAQALAVFVLFKKYDSIGWREGSALFMFLTVFATAALTGQVFHLPGNDTLYFISCSLLGLPILYIMRSTSPVLLYLGAIMIPFWGYDAPHLSLYALLLALIAPLIVHKLLKEPQSVGSRFLSWVIGGYGILAVWLFGNDSRIILPAWLLYFGLLYLTDAWISPSSVSYWLRPFKISGALGIITILFILSWETFWLYPAYYPKEGSLLTLMWTGCLGLSVYTGIKRYGLDWLNLSLLASVLLISLLYTQNLAGLSLVDNLLLFYLSVVFILSGIRRGSFALSNAGMAILLLLTAFRFFDSDLSLLIRGIVFLLLGIAFLLLNYRLSKLQRKGELL